MHKHSRYLQQTLSLLGKSTFEITNTITCVTRLKQSQRQFGDEGNRVLFLLYVSDLNYTINTSSLLQ